MGRIRKIGILVLLSFALSTPLYANMPVIDLSAIAQGISQFLTTVQQYSRQIQQWKSEYDKMVKAAKAIASGDFSQIMSGIASFANQIAGWDSTNKYADSFLRNLGSSAKLTDTIYKMSDDLGDSLGNAWNWVTSIESPDDIWSGLDTVGDVVGGVASSVSRNTSLLASYTGKIADLGTRIAAMDQQLENGALGISEEEVESLEEQLATAREEMQTAYDEWQNQLRSASDANDIANDQLEAAYNKAAEKVAELEEQLQKMYDAQDKVLSANRDAQQQVAEQVSKMAASLAANAANEEAKATPESYVKNHSFGGFN